MQCANTINPAVICLVETYLNERDKVSFEGYQCFSLNCVTEGGGILIGVNNNLVHISIEVNETNGKEEMRWILINNSSIKIRIWVVYIKQESGTTVQELAKCKKKIEN